MSGEESEGGEKEAPAVARRRDDERSESGEKNFGRADNRGR